MGQNSKISWTDHTFNPWIGCSKVHTGCANCYAEALMDKRFERAKWGKNGTRVRTQTWDQPRKWNAKAQRNGVRYRVFCASLADVFEDWRKPMTGFRSMTAARHNLFMLIDQTPHLDWLILTKRPEKIVDMWPVQGRRRENVWLGTSISNQETAAAGLALLQARHLAPVLFLSIEPLLGPIDLHAIDTPDGRHYSLLTGYCGSGQIFSGTDEFGIARPSVDWVIVGGESGPNARRCRVAWISHLYHQCSGNVAFWMKQLGSNSDVKGVTGKGDHPSQWPREIAVQECPSLGRIERNEYIL